MMKQSSRKEQVSLQDAPQNESDVYLFELVSASDLPTPKRIHTLNVFCKVYDVSNSHYDHRTSGKSSPVGKGPLLHKTKAASTTDSEPVIWTIRSNSLALLWFRKSSNSRRGAVNLNDEGEEVTVDDSIDRDGFLRIELFQSDTMKNIPLGHVLVRKSLLLNDSGESRLEFNVKEEESS